jgi:hypothetical protein
MALQVGDANGAVQDLPQWVDPVYRFAGSATATQGGSADKDILLITAASSGVTRLLSAKFRLVGGGTATAAGGVAVDMRRVTVAPTGQTNVAVTGYPHDVSDPAIGSTCNITPSTSQTKGTVAKVLSESALAISLFATGGDKLQADWIELACGPEVFQKPIVIPASGFLTIHLGAALPASSVLYFDLMISEAAE